LYPTKEKTSSIVSHKEKNLFRCIPQWRKTSSVVSHNGNKTSSVVSHNGGKSLSLWDTTEENCGVVGYNAEDYSALHPTILLCCICYKEKVILQCGILHSAEKASVKWDTVHRISFCCGVGYNGRKIPALWDTTEKKLLASRDCSPLYPTTGKNLFLCVPQRRKTFSVC
jgi:hypothetical protein